jgi:23S rRNA-/tRNA-specific pseudouridylate synthase
VYLPAGKLGSIQTLSLGDLPLCLHAWKLSFRHPVENLTVAFEAPLPQWEQ